MKTTGCAQREREQTMFWLQSVVRQEASIYPHQYPCPVTLALAQQHSSKVCVMYVCVCVWTRGGREVLLNLWASSTSIHPSAPTAPPPRPPDQHIAAGEGEYPCTPQLLVLYAVRMEKIALNCVSRGEGGGNQGQCREREKGKDEDEVEGEKGEPGNGCQRLCAAASVCGKRGHATVPTDCTHTTATHKQE